MKHGKKLLALALALCMAFALAVPAFADDGDVTIGGIELPDLPTNGENNGQPQNVDHTFSAYQIFTGTIEKNGDDDVLMGVQWGNGVNAANLVAVLAGKAGTEPELAVESKFISTYQSLGGADTISNPFAGIVYDPDRPNVSADAVARALEGMAYNSYEARAFAALVDENTTNAITATGEANSLKLPTAGYYLTVDTTSVDGTQTARNLDVLALTEANDNYTPNEKRDVPKLDKQVLETNDSDATTEWDDTAADYDIDDKVPFVLTGTIAENYNLYKVYKYVFHDTLSAGLTLDYKNDAVAEENAKVLKVYVNGIQITDGYDVNATVNEDGTTSLTVTFGNLKTLTYGTDNTKIDKDSVIQVVYTATLNENATVGSTGNSNEAYLEFSNDPNSTDDGDTGTTPTDKVTVFTFELDVNKVKEDSNAENGTSPLEGAGFTLYKKYATAQTDKGEALEGGSAENGYYYKVLAIDPSGGNKPTTFRFEGLDAGEYMLKETTIPSGYNKIEDMYFTIEAVEGKDESGNVIIKELKVTDLKDENGKPMKAANGTDDAITFTPEPTENEGYTGKISTDILNLKGVVLPGTGGIGTTIFYVVGGLLIAGAGILLITKKRMKSAE